MADMIVAISEAGFSKVFNAFRDGLHFNAADSGSFGPFTASYQVAFHLKDGSLEFRDDGTMRISELDIKWDVLRLVLGIDIPEMCVGGWCIIPNPFDGCWVRLPRICVFSDNPDISLPLDLSGILTSEVSATIHPQVRYHVDPGRAPWMSDLDAEDADVANQWQIVLSPDDVDVDVFDLADIVGDLLENAANAAIDALLGWLPDWAQDAIRWLIGGVIDLIREILDIPDDIAEWIQDLLGVRLGLENMISGLVLDYLANKYPIPIEDPFPFLKGSGGLIPVKVPIQNLGLKINAQEMVLQADVGA